MTELNRLGWCEFFEMQRLASDPPQAIAARVIEEQRGMSRVDTARGLMWAEVPGKFSHGAKSHIGMPVIGDWLLVTPNASTGKSTVLRILERRTTLSRTAAGTANQQQLMAANIDTAFIVSALKQDMNLNRLERYLTLIRERQIEPVILLTKADLCSADEIQAETEKVVEMAGDVRLHAISAKVGHGLNVVSDCLAGYKTGVLLGASGAGKSTLINTLLGQALQRVNEVRAGDQKGRHTTTSRRLISLSNGGMIIDTPGMRELQIWESNGEEDEEKEREEKGSKQGRGQSQGQGRGRDHNDSRGRR